MGFIHALAHQMKIKQQAEIALLADPFAKTFICETVCSSSWCDCYVRRTSGSFDCQECSKKRSAARRLNKPEQASKDNKAWYAANKEYVRLANQAKYLRRKEREAI